MRMGAVKGKAMFLPAPSMLMVRSGVMFFE